ncbi:MAG: hypothetical protein J6W53_03080 [Candidatus Methanomethylophilaceae archaeon]|nr:hypothetical protein [Candidatus Methanomethylophilaceae archaeon]
MALRAIILDNDSTQESTVIVERDGTEIERIKVPTEKVEVAFGIVHIRDGSGRHYVCEVISRGWDTGTITCLLTVYAAEEYT